MSTYVIRPQDLANLKTTALLPDQKKKGQAGTPAGTISEDEATAQKGLISQGPTTAGKGSNRSLLVLSRTIDVSCVSLAMNRPYHRHLRRQRQGKACALSSLS